jgi:CRISPR-associated endonuclease Cas1
MAATQTLPQQSLDNKSPTQIIPRQGVVTLVGYGIRAYVDRGHLILEDGIGSDRRRGRYSRVRHGLRRLVVIGSDGMVSLGALRWLADQNASFVMLDRAGQVLATTGPVRPSDVRLRRAQALAHQSSVALVIARELVNNKLFGQEQVVRNRIANRTIAEAIAQTRARLAEARTLQAIGQVEAKGAYDYWSAWRAIEIKFPQRDLRRVPDHWRTFGSRNSPLTGSPRLAVNPPNAMLNYLYALLESEARLALAALGLDPGLGVLHMDAPSRDSLACDVMEPIRPLVDSYVFDWVTREPLDRNWFFEERDGNCRLMASFAQRLAETLPTWAQAVAPQAEWVAKEFWVRRRKSTQSSQLPTRLTESRRREGRGVSPSVPLPKAPRPLRVCRSCGAILKRGLNYCSMCSRDLSKVNLLEAAKLGRIATHSPKAEALRAETMRRQGAAKRAWQWSDLPEWLNESTYHKQIMPRLVGIKVRTISSALGVSDPYATDIRRGNRVPHPRHWLRLAQLVDLSKPG